MCTVYNIKLFNEFYLLCYIEFMFCSKEIKEFIVISEQSRDGVKVKSCRFYTLLLDRGKAMELARQRLAAAEEARKVPSRAGELVLC